jgi:hypothetical protein
MPTGNPIWYNNIQRDAFIEKHCRVCFQPDQARLRALGQGHGCPHLARAETGKLPTPWHRRRNAAWGDTYKCDDYVDKPPVNRRGVAPADTPPMLDVEPDDYRLVPVDGWPDWKADQRKSREGDHQ